MKKKSISGVIEAVGVQPHTDCAMESTRLRTVRRKGRIAYRLQEPENKQDIA